jgi:hypothetical protein
VNCNIKLAIEQLKDWNREASAVPACPELRIYDYNASREDINELKDMLRNGQHPKRLTLHIKFYQPLEIERNNDWIRNGNFRYLKEITNTIPHNKSQSHNEEIANLLLEIPNSSLSEGLTIHITDSSPDGRITRQLFETYRKIGFPKKFGLVICPIVELNTNASERTLKHVINLKELLKSAKDLTHLDLTLNLTIDEAKPNNVSKIADTLSTIDWPENVTLSIDKHRNGIRTWVPGSISDQNKITQKRAALDLSKMMLSCKSPCLKTLTLCLKGKKITDDDITPLLNTETTLDLHLELDHNDLGEKAAEKIIELMDSGTLKSISIKGNKGIGKKAGLFFSRRIQFNQLNLINCGINLEGAKNIAGTIKAGGYLPEKSLDLSDNYDLKSEGIVEILSAVATLPANSFADLQTLSLILDHCKIGNKGAQAIAEAIKNKKINLSVLSVSGRFRRSTNLDQDYSEEDPFLISDVGFIEILNAIQSTKISKRLTLNFCGNKIGNGGAKALAKLLKSGNLASGSCINLSSTLITDSGFIDIIDALQSENCPENLEFYFNHNDLRFEAQEALRDACGNIPYNTKIQMIDNSDSCFLLENGSYRNLCTAENKDKLKDTNEEIRIKVPHRYDHYIDNEPVPMFTERVITDINSQTCTIPFFVRDIKKNLALDSRIARRYGDSPKPEYFITGSFISQKLSVPELCKKNDDFINNHKFQKMVFLFANKQILSEKNSSNSTNKREKTKKEKNDNNATSTNLESSVRDKNNYLLVLPNVCMDLISNFFPGKKMSSRNVGAVLKTRKNLTTNLWQEKYDNISPGDQKANIAAPKL